MSPVHAYAASRLLVLVLAVGAGLSIVTVQEHFRPAPSSGLFLLQAFSSWRAPDERLGVWWTGLSGDPELDAGLALVVSGALLFLAFVLFHRWTDRSAMALTFFAVMPATAMLSAAGTDSLFLVLALGAFLSRWRWVFAFSAVALRGAGMALVAGLLGERLPRSWWVPVVVGLLVLALHPGGWLLVLLGGLTWWKVGPGPGVYVMALGAWGWSLVDLAFPVALAVARLPGERWLLVVHGLLLGLVTTLFVKGLLVP